jgi:hypothetical protein
MLPRIITHCPPFALWNKTVLRIRIRRRRSGAMKYTILFI